MKQIELNEEQRAAVESDAANRLVIAGAGSGKTRVLVAAVAREAEAHGAESCCVVTYTNKAAGEMRDRLEALGVSGLGWCGTLHGLMLLLCRRHHGLVGLPKKVGVLDAEQREGIVESIMRDMGVRCPTKRVLPFLDAECCVAPGAVAKRTWTKEELVAREYHLRLRQAGLVDFSSMLYHGKSVVLALAESGEWPFGSLFVDEAQDSSASDWSIYDAMPCGRKLVVGDDCQAIYGFRGGDVREFVKRAKDGSWSVSKMTTNYRSGPNIVQASDRLICHNKNRVDKVCYPSNENKPDNVAERECATPVEEMSFVADIISKWTTPAEPVCHCGDYCKDHNQGSGHSPVPMEEEGGPRKPGDFAVLCRTNSQCKAFAQHLKACGVPVAERRMAEVPGDWRRAKLLLTVLGNPYSDFAVRQYLEATEGQAEAARVANAAAQKMVSISEALDWRYGKGERFADVDLVRHGLSAESRDHIASAVRTMRGEWDTADLLLALGNGEQQGELAGDGVAVTTVHQSKGLEFDVVFLVGMEEGNFPTARKDEDIEESRRLCYVGITRAKEQLVLTWCNHRAQYRGSNLPPGPMEEKRRSRFISELLGECVAA